MGYLLAFILTVAVLGVIADNMEKKKKKNGGPK